MKTSRRGLFSLFAAAVVAPVAAKAAISAEPMKPSGPCKACASRLGRHSASSVYASRAVQCEGCGVYYAVADVPFRQASADPGHTHGITAPAHSNGHWWDGVESLTHKHSCIHPDGRVWVL